MGCKKKRNLLKNGIADSDIITSVNTTKSGIVFAAIAVFGWTIFSLITKKQFYQEVIGVTFSRADSFVVMDNIVIKGWVLFPIALLLFAAMIDKKSTQILIRANNRTGILRQDVKKIALSSIYLTAVELLAIAMTNGCLTKVKLNWMEQYSVFWKAEGSVYGGNIVYGNVAAGFVLSTLLEFFFLGIVFYTVYICCNKLRVSCMAAIGLIVLRIELRDYLGSYGIQYEQWGHVNWKCALCGFALLFLFLCICRWRIKRKDFLEK